MKLLLLFLTILLSPSLIGAQSVVHFSEVLKKKCTPASDILAKKIFLTILKIEKLEGDPCESQVLQSLLKTCGSKSYCEDVLVIYNEAIYKHEGKVLGQ